MIPKKSIDTIIIAKNEGIRIGACIDSASWTQNVYVVDSGSTDNTTKIAKRKKAAVVGIGSADFARLRNEGAKLATAAWLLYIDADELITPQLREEIEAVVSASSKLVAYRIPRKNYYLGREWPSEDGMVRLIRRDALISWKGSLHEHAEVKGDTGTLRNYLIHHTHRTLEEMVIKTNAWSETEAKLRFDEHHPRIVWWRLLRVMLTGFWGSFISQGGWKAGAVGWIESIYQGFSMFVTYAKLWELQQRKQ